MVLLVTSIVYLFAPLATLLKRNAYLFMLDLIGDLKAHQLEVLFLTISMLQKGLSRFRKISFLACLERNIDLNCFIV